MVVDEPPLRKRQTSSPNTLPKPINIVNCHNTSFSLSVEVFMLLGYVEAYTLILPYESSQVLSWRASIGG
jgi:hypothetical protein